jgi:hypothetical protein
LLQQGHPDGTFLQNRCVRLRAAACGTRLGTNFIWIGRHLRCTVDHIASELGGLVQDVAIRHHRFCQKAEPAQIFVIFKLLGSFLLSPWPVAGRAENLPLARRQLSICNSDVTSRPPPCCAAWAGALLPSAPVSPRYSCGACRRGWCRGLVDRTPLRSLRFLFFCLFSDSGETSAHSVG